MPVSVKRSPFERAAREGLVAPASNVVSKAEKGWIEPFLSAVMTGSSVTDAVNQAGVHITLPYKTRMTDEAFKRAWVEASEVGTEFLEQEAARRAYHGTLKPVFQKGECVGHIREYSDVLMIFLLKARKPTVYRDGVEDGALRGAIVNINVETVVRQMDPMQIPVEVVTVGPASGEQDHAGVPEAARLP